MSETSSQKASVFLLARREEVTKTFGVSWPEKNFANSSIESEILSSGSSAWTRVSEGEREFSRVL
jgi:hypothetical protein